MTWVGIVILLLLVLGGFLGWRKGALRSLVNLIGLVAILILSFQFKDFLGTKIIEFMPFINFGGMYSGVYSVNFLFYQAIAFVIVFLLLYCVLNILINVSGMIEVLDRFTKIFELPSKIAGAILGVIEMLVYVFVIVFLLLSIPHSAKFMMNDNVAMTIVKKTPVLNAVFGYSIRVEQTQYNAVSNINRDDGELGIYLAEQSILSDLVGYRVIEADLYNRVKQDGKLHLLQELTIATPSSTIK